MDAYRPVVQLFMVLFFYVEVIVFMEVLSSRFNPSAEISGSSRSLLLLFLLEPHTKH